MAQYIIVNANQVDNFKGKGLRNGEEVPWKGIHPIPVKSPNGKYVIPAEVLEDDDIKEAFPALDALPQENDNEVVFYEYDLEGNVIN